MIKFLSLQMQKNWKLLSALLVLGMSSLSQASLLEEVDGSSAQAQAKVSLEKWAGKREEAREAFRPVLEALKALGDEAAYQVVLEREGDNFLKFVQEKARLGWQNQKIVVAYLKELYDEHTALIGGHADLLASLNTLTLSLEREQGVSADLRRLLQEKTAALELKRQEQVPVARTSAEVFVDLESQEPTVRTSLLSNDVSSKNCSTPLCTKIFYTSLGAVVGASLTILGTYLYFKYQH